MKEEDRLVNWIGLWAIGMVIAAGGPSSAQENAALKELAPTGKLRLGVVFAPVASAFFVTKDFQGQPHASRSTSAKAGAAARVPVEFMPPPIPGW